MNRLNLPDRLFRITVPCQFCGGRIRFPLNKGTIRILCPHCRSAFIFRTDLRHLAWVLRWKIGAMFSPVKPAAESAADIPLPRPSGNIRRTMVLIALAAVIVVFLLNLFDRRPDRRYPCIDRPVAQSFALASPASSRR